MTRNFSLDAMRGVAAVAVVLFHATAIFGTNVAPHGYLAVDLFFVLSGYVIAKSYDRRFVDGLGPAQFAMMRVLRFYPLYMLGLLLGLMKELSLFFVHNPHAFSPTQLVMAVTAGAVIVPFPYRDANMFPLNVPSWSLFFELLINIIYCVSFPLWNERRLGALLLVSGAILTVLVVQAGTADLGAQIDMFVGGSFRTIFSFGTGVFLARSVVKLPSLPTSFLLASVGGLLLVPVVGAWFDLLFIFVLSPLLVALGSTARESKTALPLYSYLGAISFPIYAIHRPLLSITESAAKLLHKDPIILGIGCIVGLLMICPVLARHYDDRIRRIIANKPRPV